MNTKSKRFFFSAAFAVIGLAATAQKKAPLNWHLSDPKTTGFYGVSLDKAYEFLKGKKSNTVVVAVIDSGIDTLHEDLRPILWTNPREIPGNGIDDDKNGYVDDVHGWNFLGGKDGRSVGKDSYEAARFYHRYKAKFEGVTNASTLSKEDKELYAVWLKAKADISKGVDVGNLAMTKMVLKMVRSGDSIIAKDLGKKEYAIKDIKTYNPSGPDAANFKNMLMRISAMNNNNVDITNKEIIEEMESELSKMESVETPPPAYRADIVKDNEEDINDRAYGNPNVQEVEDGLHGTHVSGIIGAAHNGKGVDGVADNVRIMLLRAVPDGDEHDKDIALAIRYAADNGAKVINMSFGKGVSPHKEWVDEAARYAESKGVLLVQAAGNEGADIDTAWNFPSRIYKDTKLPASNWVVVGASDAEKASVVPYFSNFGKKAVDVFAPGVDVYSTVPGGNYRKLSGTSMASPVVAGLAALILEYYPKFTPQQVKAIIEQSAVPFTGEVPNPATGEKVKLSDMSRTGGIINAYTAVLLADELARTGKFKTDGSKIKVDDKELKIKKETLGEKKKEKIKSA